MTCPGVHCPGCKGGTGFIPLVIIGTGAWLAARSPTFTRALDVMLVCTLITAGSLVLLTVAGIVLSVRANRPVNRSLPAGEPVRVTAQVIRPEPVAASTRPAVAPPASAAGYGAYEPPARVLRRSLRG